MKIQPITHTPTPWEASTEVNDGVPSTWIGGAFEPCAPEDRPDDEPDYEGGNRVILEVISGDREEVDAAFIVRAVNNHEELLDACRKAYGLIAGECKNGKENHIAKILHEVIGKAEAE